MAKPIRQPEPRRNFISTGRTFPRTTTPFGKTLEEAQALIERTGREKGADAIVFEGIVSETSAPTYTTTEKIEKNDDGSKTRTATTSQSVFTTNRLLATFIKYKK